MCVRVFCCKASSLLKPAACTRPGEKVPEMKTSFVGVTGLIHKSQGRIFCGFISPFCAIALASQTPHVHLLVALVGSSVQRTHKERPGQSWASIQTPIRMKPSKKNIGKSVATTVSLEVSRSWIRKNMISSLQPYFQVCNVALVSAAEMSLGLWGMALKDLGFFAIVTLEHLQQIFAATPHAKIPGGQIGAFHTQVRRSVHPGLAKILQCISGFKPSTTKCVDIFLPNKYLLKMFPLQTMAPMENSMISQGAYAQHALVHNVAISPSGTLIPNLSEYIL